MTIERRPRGAEPREKACEGERMLRRTCFVVRSPIRRIRGEREERVEDHSSVEGSRGEEVVGMRGTRGGDTRLGRGGSGEGLACSIGDVWVMDRR